MENRTWLLGDTPLCFPFPHLNRPCSWGAWLAQSLEHAIPGLGVMNLSPRVDGRDYFKQKIRTMLL